MKLLVGLSLIACILPAWSGECRTVALHGIVFSDEQGGFVLEKVTGRGSIADPFVVVERITDEDGGILTFRADPSLGNLIGSPDAIGFALVKVIKNATGHAWSGLEIELQSQLGVPSGHTDELSYGQGTTLGRPFTASAFAVVSLMDEPYDRIECTEGDVPSGGAVTLRFVVSQPRNLREAFIAQRPARPVASRPTPPSQPGAAGVRAQRADQRAGMALMAPPPLH